MKKYNYLSYHIADIGDYLKVFACTAVMSQPIMSMIIDLHQSTQTQFVFGILYNLVKYTAPAFIFGILYIPRLGHMIYLVNFLTKNIYVVIGQIYSYQLSGGL